MVGCYFTARGLFISMLSFLQERKQVCGISMLFISLPVFMYRLSSFDPVVDFHEIDMDIMPL
jgi:hypothetical protein